MSETRSIPFPKPTEAEPAEAKSPFAEPPAAATAPTPVERRPRPPARPPSALAAINWDDLRIKAWHAGLIVATAYVSSHPDKWAWLAPVLTAAAGQSRAPSSLPRPASIGAVILAALLLGGCVTAEDAAVATGVKKYDTVTFNRGQFFKAWNNVSVTYAVAMYQLRVACVGPSRKLDADICQSLDRIDDQARLINDSVTTALSNPEATLNFDQIMKYAQLGMDLALKLGVKAVLPIP